MVLAVLIKMAKVIVTLKIMPDDVDVDLDRLENEIKGILKGKSSEVKTERVAIAFGLNSLNVFFVWDESEGTDKVEESLRQIEGIASVEMVDVRRAIG